MVGSVLEQNKQLVSMNTEVTKESLHFTENIIKMLKDQLT